MWLQQLQSTSVMGPNVNFFHGAQMPGGALIGDVSRLSLKALEYLPRQLGKTIKLSNLENIHCELLENSKG